MRERFCWGVFLFALANAPALLAKGCTDINDYGYRILTSSMIMGTLVIFKIFILSQTHNSIAIKRLTIFFILSSLLAGFWLEIGAVQNSHKEYQLAMDQLNKTDFSKTNRLLFIVNNRGETLINRKLPMEFSLLSVLPEHVNAYVLEYLHNKPYTIPPPKVINHGMKVFVPPGTKVIDLSSETINKSKNPREDDIDIMPQSLLANNVSVKVLESNDGKDVVVGFETVSGQQGRLPLWLIEDNEKTVTMEITSHKTLPLTGYNCFVSTQNPNTQGSIKWVLQGSNDGANWFNLDMQSNVLPLEKAILITYPLKYGTFFNRYRFVWNKEQYSERIGIELIKLKFLN